MNHLVFLDSQAGELEKILSGVKTMVLRGFDPAPPAGWAVSPGDSLYFLRDQADCTVRVQATVVRVLVFTDDLDEDLSHTLKEMQPRLQLTEHQYNDWSARKQVLLVEFEAAHKIGAIHVPAHAGVDRSNWTAFEGFSLLR